ncbi:hypothetical protein AMECASPLE_013847 [Ameca splendens]|uniref:Uncharacterized protein n=1 Tax=Ameca splendens TaxID=208324 RepID=A0ABV0YZF3_9TELE
MSLCKYYIFTVNATNMDPGVLVAVQHPMNEAARKGVTTKCLQRVRQVLRSHLNGKDQPPTDEEVADIEKSYQSIETEGLKNHIEALIMVAQEQAFSTRANEARAYHS